MLVVDEEIKAKPFIKWAGGKSQLIYQLQNFYPKELYSGIIDTYIEPFIGGGAVFFNIIQNFQIKSAYISDVNKDLILAYKVVQQKADKLCGFLEKYQDEYDHSDQEKREKLYYKVRNQFNNQRFGINYNQFSDKELQRTSQLIFLNKTCFNGLFRLNSKGEFNVPFGKYTKLTILDRENIISISSLLNNVDISASHFKDCFDKITSNTFVYFDPPYKPLNKTASFTTYAGSCFTDKEQIELADFYRKIDNEKQAKLMLSNSDPKFKNINDNFFEMVYKGYNIQKVDAKRTINCNGEKRGKIKELVITNY